MSTPYDTQNIFAKILRGEVPAQKVFEDDYVMAIMDVMPQGPGHTLLIPKAPVRNILDADEETLRQLLPRVQKIARAVKSAFNADGVTVLQFNEEAGGQSVFHLHIHVIPRFEGKSLKPHSGKMEDPQALKDAAEKIRAALADSE